VLDSQSAVRQADLLEVADVAPEPARHKSSLK
jgi:hypothetical protein